MAEVAFYNIIYSKGRRRELRASLLFREICLLFAINQKSLFITHREDNIQWQTAGGFMAKSK